MTTITILRAYYGDCTTGRLRTNKGFQCLTLELPWRGNEQGKSCIPEGDYNYRVALSPRLGVDVVWLDGVDNRINIQIHPGNYTRQILGCILPGNAITDIDGDGILDVSQSQVAFNKLLANIDKTGLIKIRSAAMPGKGVYK